MQDSHFDASNSRSGEGNGHHPIEDSRLHPSAAYSAQPKGPVDYTLVHWHPSRLLPVLKDNRRRTGSDYQQFFESFVEDLRQRGVQQPLIAVREGDAARAVDGETRRQAAPVAGLDSIPVLVYEYALSDSQLVLAQLVAKAQRRDLTELALAAIYVELIQLSGSSQAQLARNIHVSAAEVSKVLAISKKLCPDVQELVAAGKLAPRAAYQISRLEPQRQIELADKFVKGLLCVEGVEANVATQLGRRQKRPKSLKLVHAGVVAVVEGNAVDALKAFIAKAAQAIEKLETDDLPPEMLRALMKNPHFPEQCA